MHLAAIESILGNLWFGVAMFAAGLLLADPIKAAIKKLINRG